MSIAGASAAGDEEERAVADTLFNIDAGIERIENRGALRPLLNELPERERAVLALPFFESMTPDAVERDSRTAARPSSGRNKA